MMSSEEMRNAILIILMANDPVPMSVEDIQEETINGVTELEITDGLNDLFSLCLVQSIASHPPNAGYRPSAIITPSGQLHLKKLVAKTLAEVLIADRGDDGDVSDHLKVDI